MYQTSHPQTGGHQEPLQFPKLPIVSAEPVEWCVELNYVGAKKDKIPHLEEIGCRGL